MPNKESPYVVVTRTRGGKLTLKRLRYGYHEIGFGREKRWPRTSCTVTHDGVEIFTQSFVNPRGRGRVTISVPQNILDEHRSQGMAAPRLRLHPSAVGDMFFSIIFPAIGKKLMLLYDPKKK